MLLQASLQGELDKKGTHPPAFPLENGHFFLRGAPPRTPLGLSPQTPHPESATLAVTIIPVGSYALSLPRARHSGGTREITARTQYKHARGVHAWFRILPIPDAFAVTYSDRHPSSGMPGRGVEWFR